MNATPNRKRQAGFSLVELMVAGTVGLIIIGGAISIFANTVASNTNVLKTTRLEEELATIMSLMVRDIRRAGFTPDAYDPANVGTGTFTNPFNTVAVADVDGDSPADDFDCVTYSYDEDGNDTLDTPGEQFGFRLNGGTVEKRAAGAACDGSGWQDLGDSNAVTITNLDFELNTMTVTAAAGPSVTVRSLDITLSGELANDATINRTIEQRFRIRNDQ